MELKLPDSVRISNLVLEKTLLSIYHFKNDNTSVHTKFIFNKLARRSYQRKLEVTRVGHFITIPNQIIEHNEIQINSEKYIEQVKN